MKIKYPEIGVCGLSCRLCPNYHIQSENRCAGCKSTARMKVGCPFITCAVKKRGIEFCWQCTEQDDCQRWHQRREWSKHHDSFVCYQRLEDNIAIIKHKGISAFVKAQQAREQLLTTILDEFNEGRSKTFYCIAATVMEIQELKQAIVQAQKESKAMDKRDKSKSLHSIINAIAEKKKYGLKLRKLR